MSAQQLGHSVTVAEKHYLGVVRGIAKEAKTLEQAIQIEDLTRKVVDCPLIFEKQYETKEIEVTSN
jgi:hypothetical protein